MSFESPYPMFDSENTGCGGDDTAQYVDVLRSAGVHYCATSAYCVVTMLDWEHVFDIATTFAKIPQQ